MEGVTSKGCGVGARPAPWGPWRSGYSADRPRYLSAFGDCVPLPLGGLGRVFTPAASPPEAQSPFQQGNGCHT